MTAPFGHLPISDLTGSNDEGGRAKKRRSININDTPQRLEIEKASLAESQKLVAIVNLAWLNPNWGQRMEANRPLSERHVQPQVDDFPRIIRRFDVDNRCKASADPVLIQRLIDATEKSDKLQSFAEENPTRLGVIDLRTIDMSLSPEGPVGQFTLDAGQHRRAVVLRLNGLEAYVEEGVFTNVNLDSPDT